MRFLIFSFAALACAAAAPSHLLPYAAYSAIPAIPAFPYAALPTVSPGDIQGAVIDAHVKATDYAQAAVDQARLLNEQAVDNANSLKWASEEKKWQALEAQQIAEAQADGDIASKADFAAKAEDDSEKVETAAKTDEPAKEAETEKEKTVDAVAVAAKAATDLKAEADKALAALKTPVITPVAVAGAISYTAAYPYSGVAVAPAWADAIALNSGLKYSSTVQHLGPFATSTFLKTQW